MKLFADDTTFMKVGASLEKMARNSCWRELVMRSGIAEIEPHPLTMMSARKSFFGLVSPLKLSTSRPYTSSASNKALPNYNLMDTFFL